MAATTMTLRPIGNRWMVGVFCALQFAGPVPHKCRWIDILSLFGTLAVFYAQQSGFVAPLRGLHNMTAASDAFSHVLDVSVTCFNKLLLGLSSGLSNFSESSHSNRDNLCSLKVSF